jgi:ATP-binding protein involved in chromosome partitioning
MDSVPVVAVCSGKGGVGETSVAVSLARDLAATGRRVGLLDADLSGPDVPRMLGIRRDAPAESVQVSAVPGSRHSAVEAVSVDGLRVASVGFLIGGQQGLALAAPMAELLLARLIRQTAWGPLDVLVIDLPPGAGDVQVALLRMYAQVAVMLVVSPDEMAHLDTGRAVAVLRQARAYLLGGIENMAYLCCPDCGAPDEHVRWDARGPHHLGARCHPARPAPVPPRRRHHHRGHPPGLRRRHRVPGRVAPSGTSGPDRLCLRLVAVPELARLTRPR